VACAVLVQPLTARTSAAPEMSARKMGVVRMGWGSELGEMDRI
jgi:hypothetical protein